MPENTILLVPMFCLIAIGVLVRRGTRATAEAPSETLKTLEVTLECDTAPARQALQLLNADLERTRALLADVESGAAAIAKAGQVARDQRKQGAKPSNQRRREPPRGKKS